MSLAKRLQAGLLRPNQVDVMCRGYRVVFRHVERALRVGPTSERGQEGSAAVEREVSPAGKAATFLAIHQEVQGFVAR